MASGTEPGALWRAERGADGAARGGGDGGGGNDAVAGRGPHGTVGDEGIRVKLDVTANRVSTKARRIIEQAGGKVVESGTRRDTTRGIDRNAEDKAPKNLTKKLTRGKNSKGKKAVADAAEPAEAEGVKKKK
jgi:hypothetical protein